MQHELKTDPIPFDDVVSGKKKCEIRYNDRGFKVGDTLKLRKTKWTGDQMKSNQITYPLEYIAAPLYCYVTHVQRGYCLKDGWVILSIEVRDGCS